MQVRDREGTQFAQMFFLACLHRWDSCHYVGYLVATLHLVSMMLNTLPWCQICCQWCYISRDGLELEAKKTRATESASQISDLTVEGDEAIVHGVNDGGNMMGVNLEQGGTLSLCLHFSHSPIAHTQCCHHQESSKEAHGKEFAVANVTDVGGCNHCIFTFVKVVADVSINAMI